MTPTLHPAAARTLISSLCSLPLRATSMSGRRRPFSRPWQLIMFSLDDRRERSVSCSLLHVSRGVCDGRPGGRAEGQIRCPSGLCSFLIRSAFPKGRRRASHRLDADARTGCNDAIQRLLVSGHQPPNTDHGWAIDVFSTHSQKVAEAYEHAGDGYAADLGMNPWTFSQFPGRDRYGRILDVRFLICSLGSNANRSDGVTRYRFSAKAFKTLQCPSLLMAACDTKYLA